MSWFLVTFLIFQIIPNNWSAPVESMSTSQDAALSNVANNLTKRWEDVVNNTEMAFAKGVYKLNNSLTEVQQRLDETTESKPDTTDFATKVAESKFSNNETENHSTFEQTTIESSTKYEELLQETTYPSKTQEVSTTQTPEFSLTKSSEKDEDLTTALVLQPGTEIPDTTSLPTESNVKTPQTPIFKQAIDSFIGDILEIGDKLGLIPDSSVSKAHETTTEVIGEEMNTNAYLTTEKPNANELRQTKEHFSLQTPNLADSTTEIYNRNIKQEEDTTVINEQTSTQAYVNENTRTIHNATSTTNTTDAPTTTTATTITANTTTSSDTTLSASHTEEDHTASELTHENSQLTNPASTETFDSFINQLSTIEQSIEKSVDEVIKSSSIQKLEEPNAELQTEINESATKYIPAFKQAIDAFIEDIIDVGEKLDLAAPSTTHKQLPIYDEFFTKDVNQETTSPKATNLQHYDLETSLTTLEPILYLAAKNLNQTTGHIQTTTTSNEISMTPSTIESLSESLNGTIETAFQNFAAETTKQSSATNAAISPETGHELQIEKSTEKLSSEEQNLEKLEKDNYTIPTLEFLHKTSTNSIYEDQKNIEVFHTTSNSIGTTESSQENVRKDTTVSQMEKVESNFTPQREEHQNETATGTQQPELGSLWVTTEMSYQTERNEEENIEELETTSTKNYITKNEAFRLNEQGNETAASIYKSKDSDALIQTSSVAISHLPQEENTETLLPKLSITETTQTNQNQFSTSPASVAFTTESSIIEPVIETTIKTRSFPEELQTHEITLEETTHHQLENSVKQIPQQLDGLEGEKESPKQYHTTTENQDEQAFPSITENETRTELPRSGVIRQDFIDKFADNDAGIVNMTVTSTEKELLLVQESSFKETPNTTTRNTSTVEKFKVLQEDVMDNADLTRADNDSNDSLVTTPAANIMNEETINEIEITTTEYTSETTTETNIVRVALEKDVNSFSLNTTAQVNAVISAQDATTLNPQPKEIQQTSLELSAATKRTEPEEETTVLPLPTTGLKEEMVTFIEVTAATTKATQLFEENKQEYRATTETQQIQTQTVLMHDQQQQIESTTESAAQIESTDASEQTATTAIHEDTQTEQQTTETEINSTTVVEEYETTVTPKEPEARSLSLPPPKLEYLQSDEGVEVFYGYSSVKHN